MNTVFHEAPIERGICKAPRGLISIPHVHRKKKTEMCVKSPHKEKHPPHPYLLKKDQDACLCVQSPWGLHNVPYEWGPCRTPKISWNSGKYFRLKNKVI